jgi:hypothetical protein
VFVKNDTIVDVVVLYDQTKLHRDSWKEYHPIKDLFAIISNTDTAYYDLEVVMDTTYHYPSYLFINPRPRDFTIDDASVSFSTSNYIKSK